MFEGNGVNFDISLDKVDIRSITEYGEKNIGKVAGAEKIKSHLRQSDRTKLGNSFYKGVGAEITEGMSVDDMLNAADLNWKVATSLNWYGDKKQFVDTKEQAVHREDTGEKFCNTGANWVPFQNREIVEIFADFCEKSNLEIERMGHLRGGKLVFASAILNEQWDVMGTNDTVAGRLILTNSHDWGQGLSVKLSTVRLACCNGNTNKINVQRTLAHNSLFTKESIGAILESSKTSFANMGELFDKMANTPMNNREARHFLLQVIGKKDREGNLLEFEKQEREVRCSFEAFVTHSSTGAELETSQGTAWELFNCVTEHLNHNARSAGEQHINSIWNGGKADTQTKLLNAFDYALNKSKNKNTQTVGVRAF